MLYDIAFLIFSIFYLPTLIFKGRLHKGFLERFGIYNDSKKTALSSAADKIWIQAVSVGEVKLCERLISLLKAKLPGCQIVLSTITKTGNALAKKIFQDRVTVIYFPLDLSFIVKRVVGQIRPKIYIMVETEIWPNMLKELSSRATPSILINGRISDESFTRYSLVRPFLKNTLKRIDKFCMQSATDAQRIIKLSAPERSVKITGNMKFDAEQALAADKVEDLRRAVALADDESLFVAGSTHRGEEEILLEVFRELIKEFPRLKLLIATRHVDRVKKVENVIRAYGFEPARISALNERRTASDERRIYILDTIGQLNGAYALATIVFIGGSLVKHGGQNPIEPALLEKAVLFGPHMFNFKDAARLLLVNSGAIQVEDENDLARKAAFLLRDEDARSEFGRNAKKTVSENRGATLKNLEAISSLLQALSL